MSIERTKSKQKVKEPKTKITWKEIKRQKVLLFWAAIMVVYGVVFYHEARRRGEDRPGRHPAGNTSLFLFLFFHHLPSPPTSPSRDRRARDSDPSPAGY